MCRRHAISNTGPCPYKITRSTQGSTTTQMVIFNRVWNFYYIYNSTGRFNYRDKVSVRAPSESFGDISEHSETELVSRRFGGTASEKGYFFCILCFEPDKEKYVLGVLGTAGSPRRYKYIFSHNNSFFSTFSQKVVF